MPEPTPPAARPPTADRVTIDDVADRAGVSTATVSRVTNAMDRVSEDTREQVLTAARALGYRPDRTARALGQNGGAPTIAVALPTFTTPFHNELLKGVRDRLDAAGPDLLLCDLQWEAPRASLEAFLERGAVDGLLVAGISPTEGTVPGELALPGAPVVLLGAPCNGLDSFSWKEATGARVATEHLLDRGHRRIGLIRTHHESPVRAERTRGYRRALRDAGVRPRAAWVASGETDKHDGYSEEAGREAARALLHRASGDGAPGPSAVFASSDVQAIGAWQAFREQGVAVPDDIALVGYDDVKVSRHIGLTSVSQKMRAVGRAATALLRRRLRGAGPSGPRSETIMPELVERAST
jgi:LacI family transcriptional regulator